MKLEPHWSDWRAFLALTRSGSTLAAARMLKVSQTTVARRASALEEALGLLLFERRTDGCTLTEAGKSLLPKAEAIESAITAAHEAAKSLARGTRGRVRVTVAEVYADVLLTPNLSEFHRLHSDVQIEVDTCDEFRDLAGGEADVALRSDWQFEEASLVGRRLCDDDWTFYASRGYAENNELPSSIKSLAGHPILGGGGTAWPAYKSWLQRHDLLHYVTFHYSSVTGILGGVRQGVGVSALPCWIAEADPNLLRCFPPPRSGRGLWLLSHETRCQQPHVRAVIDFFYGKLSAHIKATPPWPIRVDPPTQAPLTAAK